jgi:adenylate kinase family enzyme
MNENNKGVLAKKRKVASIEPSKPRNFVAKNAINTGAGAHKDKKKAMKQGDTKHKKLDYAENLELQLNQKLQENKLDEFLPVVGMIAGRAAVGAEAGALTRGVAGLAGREIGKALEPDDTDEDVDSPEYNDEAGMSYGSLHTIARAADGLLDTIKEGDNLPEWCQEKISLAEDYLITVWDYLQSEKEQGVAEGVTEGVNDPHIFKCIFLFGPMGAGKSTVARPLLSHTGLRSVNLDNFNELFVKKGQVPTGHLSPDQLEKSWQLTQAQQKSFIDSRLGVIIDGSGRNPDTAIGVIEKLMPLGYEFMMIFVNVSEATSIARQQSRAEKQKQQWGAGRQVDPTLAKNTYAQVQKMLGKYSAYFGPQKFVYVDNENTPDLEPAEKKVDAFLRAPITQPEAIEWIQSQKGGQQVAQKQQKLATAQDRQQQALTQFKKGPFNSKFSKPITREGAEKSTAVSQEQLNQLYSKGKPMQFIKNTPVALVPLAKIDKIGTPQQVQQVQQALGSVDQTSYTDEYKNKGYVVFQWNGTALDLYVASPEVVSQKYVKFNGQLPQDEKSRGKIPSLVALSKLGIDPSKVPFFVKKVPNEMVSAKQLGLEGKTIQVFWGSDPSTQEVAPGGFLTKNEHGMIYTIAPDARGLPIGYLPVQQGVAEGGYSGYDDNRTRGFAKRGREDDEYHVPDPVAPEYNIKVNGEVINRQPFANRAEALAWAKQAVAAGKLDPKTATLSPINKEGASISTTPGSIDPGGAVDNFKQQMANNTEIAYQKKQQSMAEGSQEINWVKPNFDFEWHEVEEQSRMKQVPVDVRQYYQKHFPNKDAWLKAVQNGKAVVVPPDHAYEIRNAPFDKASLQKVLAPTGHEGPIGPAKEKRVNDLFDKGQVEMPIILKTSQGLWLIGGKTRLGTANYVKGLPAKVWLISGKQGVAEGWSQKYKSSINCSHPKGFSQKAHCAGKKKHNEDMSMEAVCPDCGMCEAHGNSKIYDKCWTGYKKVPGKKRGEEGSCKKIGESVAEKLNLKTMDTDAVIKDFEKSNAPQFRGKTKEKRKQMAIAAKMGAMKKKKKIGESLEEWTTDSLASHLFEQELTYEDRLNNMLSKKLSK